MADHEMTQHNLSVGSIQHTPVKEDGVVQLLDDDTARTISKVILYGISPAIGIVGVTLNCLSIAVLYRHGLHKCSNILLISLAFLDASFLIGYNNIPYLLYSLQGGWKFVYSEPVSHTLYILYFLFMMMDYGLGLAGFCIPMFITIERLVAVFIPLKFGQIITPFRTWLVVISNTVFWVGVIMYTMFWYKFEYVFDKSLNRSVGLISKSDLFYKDYDGIPIFQEIFFSVKIPPLVTMAGCIAIIVKIKSSSKKRSEMTSGKQTSTSKTTKTLLAVCFGYFFTCALLAIPTYLPEELAAYSLTSNTPTNAGVIIYQCICIITNINASWNFIIYVGLNKNFRDTFKELIYGTKKS